MWANLLIFMFICTSRAASYQDYADNEFAEFEDDTDEVNTAATLQHPQQQNTDDFGKTAADADEDEAIVNDLDDDEDSDFEYFQDVEEFEGFEMKEEKPSSEPKIIIAEVPSHFTANWVNYWLEILMVAGLVVYVINFLMGKSKNQKIANAWFQTHKTLLEDNFALVGDDGNLERQESHHVMKESENVFTLWCSGRTCCEGMLVELRLLKRQDLLSVFSGLMRPTVDQVHIRVTMNKDDMDSFVFCVAAKKSALVISKEMIDLSLFCPEKRPGEKFNIPAQFSVMSELSEAASAMLDSKITAILTKYVDLIDYIHISDQYSGVKQADEQPALKLPECTKVMHFGFNMPLRGMPLNDAVEQMKPLLVMVFYYMEKIKRFRLPREARAKADKNRQKVEEAYLKSTHQARAEAAAARREEKRRLEKEKVMADEDPERQRRWEEKEQKRQAKKRAPKMKQLKVKAL